MTTYNNKPLLAVLFLTSLSFSSITSPFYINDSSGNLGEVNVATRQVRVIGNMGVTVTDIAFDPQGNLYGLSRLAFYRIDPQTAAITLIGRHGIPCGNALEFDDTRTLFAAGCSTTSLFTVDIATGVATPFGNMGFSSRGDLAFNNGTLYLAASTNQLVRIELANGAVGTAVGPFGFRSVFGLDTDTNRTLFGFSNTTVFSVDPPTGVGTPVFDYGGHGLGRANGASFPGPPPPPQSVADLALSITDTPDPVTVGTTLTYQLLVSNNGPAAATGVVLTDTLPSGVNVVSIPPSCSSTSTVTCNLGTLASAGHTEVDIAVMPTVAGTITNTASVTANETDPDSSNSTTIRAVTLVQEDNTPACSSPDPRVVSVDNTGAFGAYEGAIKSVVSDEVTTVALDLQGTVLELPGLPDRELQLWASIEGINIEPDTAGTIEVNTTDAIGSLFAGVGLIAPGTHASFLAHFCRPGTVVFQLGFSRKAIALTIADTLISIIPQLGDITTSKILAFATTLNTIPLYASAVTHVAIGFEAASKGRVRTASRQLAKAGRDLTRLARDRRQRARLRRAFRDLAIDVTGKKLFRKLVRAPAHVIEVFSDFIAFSTLRGFSREPIVIKLVAPL